MSEENLRHHFDLITEFLEDTVDFEEWHEVQVVTVLKSGDLYDLNKWRGVNLMDIGAKVFSSLICKTLFKIIKEHIVKYQFVSSPGVGCQGDTFTIKTLFHTWHNHNLPSYVAFVNIVKAFDTVNYDTMLKILERYVATPKLRSAVSIMYRDLNIVLKNGKAQEKMGQTVGVRQGDCMSPVLLLFMVMAFTESLEKEWIKVRLKYEPWNNTRTHLTTWADLPVTRRRTSPKELSFPSSAYCT